MMCVSVVLCCVVFTPCCCILYAVWLASCMCFVCVCIVDWRVVFFMNLRAHIKYDKASCLESSVAALRRQDPIHARGNYEHALYHRVWQEILREWETCVCLHVVLLVVWLLCVFVCLCCVLCCGRWVLRVLFVGLLCVSLCFAVSSSLCK